MAEVPSESDRPVDDRSPAGPSSPARSPGLREALLAGELTVVVVLLAAVATFLLPGGRDIVLQTPLLILVLIGGTAAVLWRISRPGRPER